MPLERSQTRRTLSDDPNLDPALGTRSWCVSVQMAGILRATHAQNSRAQNALYAFSTT